MTVELERYLAELVRRVSGVLGEELAGLYLHGSAAMDAFVPSRSDVDVLAVTRGSISREAKRAVADAVSTAALPGPGVGLKLSIVTEVSARTESDAPRFELHIDCHESHDDRIVDGAEREGDPDLVTAFAMARERGVVLFGRSPMEILPPVDRARVLRAVAGDLEWGIENRLGGYAVLNACRALRFAREGRLSSKSEGGRWALANGIGDPDVIRVALRRQAGSEEEVDLRAATAFAEQVRKDLLVEASSKPG